MKMSERASSDLSEEENSVCSTSLSKDFLSNNNNIESDEEECIINEIKDEIKKKVREDIKEELAKYDLAKLDSRSQSVASSQLYAEDEGPNFLPEMDIKYQEAYKKMQKLDAILRKKMAREREVKQERRMLEKRLREELEELEKSGRRSKDEITNTLKFLAIEPMTRYPDEMLSDEYSEPSTPVFQTEYLFEQSNSTQTTARKSTDSRTGSKASETTTNLTDDDKQRERLHKRKSSKDFIKRNRQLAAAAGEVIAMTPEEHMRLDRLLQDLDSLPELPEEFEDDVSSLNVALKSGEGFSGSEVESQKLRDIETGLQSLLSAEEYESARLTESEALGESHYRRLRTFQGSNNLDLEKLGERALAEVKEHRDMTHRLEEVESRLSTFQSQFADQRLQPHEITDLVEDCRRCLSQSSYRETVGSLSQFGSVADAESVRSEVVAIPQLERSVLDKLLQDARAQGIGNWAVIEEDDEENNALDEESDTETERLKLPDIKLFENMSAPRSSRSSSRLHNSASYE